MLSSHIKVKNILLVNNEHYLICFLEKLLIHEGYNVILVDDGILAVKYYKDNPKSVDLVLMDITKPFALGTAAYKELIELAPDLLILLMSVYSHKTECVNDFETLTMRI